MKKGIWLVALIATLMSTGFVYAEGFNSDAWIEGVGWDSDADEDYTDATDVYFYVYASVRGTGEGYAQARAGTEGGGKGWILTETSNGGTFQDSDYHDSYGKVWASAYVISWDEGISADAEVEVEW